MAEKELFLREIYYSPKIGYRNPEHLYKLVKEEHPGLDISRSFVKNWLLKQSSYTRFKKWNHPKHYRHTFVRDFDQMQMDLVFMPEKYKDENEGYYIILTAIDILSRFAFAEDVKSKRGVDVKPKMEKILEEYKERFGKYPKAIQFDEGNEFLNKNVRPYLESLEIEYFFTYSPRKASVVERLNRTLKTLTMKVFESHGDHRWKEYLEEIVENYNHRFHSGIGMKPAEVDEENKYIVWGRLYGKIVDIKNPKYKVGDLVRVLKLTRQYRIAQLIQRKEMINYLGKDGEKTFGDKLRDKYKEKDEEKITATNQNAVALRRPPFSREILRIESVMLGDPVVYKLYSDEFKVEIPGIFYEEELSLVKE